MIVTVDLVYPRHFAKSVHRPGDTTHFIIVLFPDAGGAELIWRAYQGLGSAPPFLPESGLSNDQLVFVALAQVPHPALV